jgi:hypothetical protein
MTAFTSPAIARSSLDANSAAPHAAALLQGEILIQPLPYSPWGGAVTAKMFLPIERSQVWPQLTNYSRWVEYFPAVTRSQLLHGSPVIQPDGTSRKRLYQAASKAFLFLVAEVEVYLTVLETTQQRIQFILESGSFNDFAADLNLQDYGKGTLLTYQVQATPTIPVPGPFIQHAIQMDLPENMRNMRKVLCRGH